jgi:hypothetical protein
LDEDRDGWMRTEMVVRGQSLLGENRDVWARRKMVLEMLVFPPFD